MADFVIKQGDCLPVLSSALTYSDGSIVNLTGSTVVLVLYGQAGPVTLTGLATVVSATAGTVSYTFTAADTATAGRYAAEWQITVNGQRQTFPSDGYLSVVVEESLSASNLPSRLVSLGAVKADLNIPASETDQDAELLRMIDAARPVVEDLCGPIIPVSRTDFFPGGRSQIALPVRFVQSITSVTECGTVLDPSLYSVDGNILTRLGGYVGDFSGGGYTGGYGGSIPRPFYGAESQVVIVYVAGCAQIPANIRFGTLELVRHWVQWGQQGNSEVFDNDGTAPQVSMAYALPNRVTQILLPSKRFPAVG